MASYARDLRAHFACALFALTLFAASSAAAQHEGVHIKRPFRGARPLELNLHAGLTHRSIGPAIGGRVAFPIVDNGFISTLDNAIYITIGADVMFERCFGGCGRNGDDYGAAFAIPLTGRWQFNFHPDWSAYGEAGPTLYIHGGWLGDGGRFPPFGRIAHSWIAVNVGGKWHFAPSTSLTLSLGQPYTHVGLDFLF